MFEQSVGQSRDYTTRHNIHGNTASVFATYLATRMLYTNITWAPQQQTQEYHLANETNIKIKQSWGEWSSEVCCLTIICHMCWCLASSGSTLYNSLKRVHWHASHFCLSRINCWLTSLFKLTNNVCGTWLHLLLITDVSLKVPSVDLTGPSVTIWQLISVQVINSFCSQRMSFWSYYL